MADLRCAFCGAELPASPPGVVVRCGSCGNVTSVAPLPPTMPFQATPLAPPTSSAMPFATSAKGASQASPPPTTVLPSRAGGWDELIGGGITILGIGLAKIALFVAASLAFSCVLGMLGFVFHC